MLSSRRLRSRTLRVGDCGQGLSVYVAWEESHRRSRRILQPCRRRNGAERVHTQAFGKFSLPEYCWIVVCLRSSPDCLRCRVPARVRHMNVLFFAAEDSTSREFKASRDCLKASLDVQAAHSSDRLLGGATCALFGGIWSPSTPPLGVNGAGIGWVNITERMLSIRCGLLRRAGVYSTIVSPTLKMPIQFPLRTAATQITSSCTLTTAGCTSNS